MRVLLLAAVSLSVFASVPVRDGCGEDASVLANIDEKAPMRVLHGMVGESVPCYAVAVGQGAGELRGFISDANLPAIQNFERQRALESRVALAAAPSGPSVPKKSKPMLPVAPPFAPWSGFTPEGKRMQIVPGEAPVTLVTFWSVESGTARRYVERLGKTASEFRPKGLKSFGLMEGGGLARAKYFLEDMGLDSPQGFDREGLAAKYNVDASKGTTLVLDGANRVVAVSSDPAQIRAAVAKLLSSE